jgi:hypothetical protein
VSSRGADGLPTNWGAANPRDVELLVDTLRAEKGPFFVARLLMRLSFRPGQPGDCKAQVAEILSVARQLMAAG